MMDELVEWIGCCTPKNLSLKVEKTLSRTFPSVFHPYAFWDFSFLANCRLFHPRIRFCGRSPILPALLMATVAFLLVPARSFAEITPSSLNTSLLGNSPFWENLFQTQKTAGTFMGPAIIGNYSVIAICLAVFLLFSLCWGLSSRRFFARERWKIIRDCLNSLPYPAWFKDRRLRFVAANKEFFAITGLDQSKIAGKRAADICPLLRELLPEFHSRRVLDTAAGLRVYHEFSDPLRGEGLKDTFRAPVINERGEVDGILGVSMNRGALVLNPKEELEAGNDCPAFFTGFRQIGILSIGMGRPTPIIIKANRGAEAILDHARSEIVDFPFTMFLADEDNYPVTGAIRRLFAEGGRTFRKQVNIIRKNGDMATVTLALTPLYSENGAIEEINAVFVPLPEEGRVVPNNREYRGNYEKILAQGPFGLFRSTMDGRFLEVNSALVKMLGFDSEEEFLAGIQKDGEVFVEREGRARILRAMVDASALEFFETVLRCKDGRTIAVSISLAPLAEGERGEAAVEGMVQDITERRIREEKIWQMAYFDALTGLPNLSLLREKVKTSIQEAQKAGHGVALISIDIDRFKDINHSLGIARGDRFLQILSQKLSHFFGSENQTVSRVEGDTFVIFLSRLTDEGEVARTLEHLQQMLGKPFQFDSQEVFITASVGVAIYPRHGLDLETLLRNANLAMHTAKDRARGTFLFYSPDMDTEALEQRDMEYRLRRALKENEFDLYYQPQINLMTRQITGVEALIRWNDPERGFVPPERFIPVAEKCGLIRAIGEWVLKTVCQHNHFWQATGFPPLRFSVNLSGHQLKQPDLLEIVDGTLLDASFLPGSLELELTESIFMAPVDVTVKALRDLKARGISLAIDDFGTGYSSLNYLKHFPIDRLKIDQSFVRDIVTEKDDAAIVEAIIAMARTLGIAVIAEGVETREQLEFLRGRHCHEMQGYYFARPMPINEMSHYFHLMKNGFSAKLARKFSRPGFANHTSTYS